MVSKNLTTSKCPLSLARFMAWFAESGDRTRRTFEDNWLLRILYVRLLFVPYFYPNMKYNFYAKILGIAMFVTYVMAIHKVRPTFWEKPKDSSEFLRNIVYD